MTSMDLILGLNAVLPELILSAVICYLLLADMFLPQERSRKVCGSLAMVGLFLALALTASQLVFGQFQASPVYFDGMIVLDRAALVFKLIILAGAFLSMGFSMRSGELKAFRFGEYTTLMLGATIGACLLTAANNFLIFLLAIETLSMCSYVLAGFLKQERFSAEAGLKYTLFGAVASGVMLFGLSYFYGLSGTLDLQRCMSSLVPAFLMQEGALPAYVALMLVLAGVGFKIAALPFHFWCPDTYQGAPTPVTAFLSVVSKTAGFAALSRLLLPVILSPLFQSALAAQQAVTLLQLLLGLLAIASMTYGNLVALKQTSVKRLLAYSAIAHAGYLLMAVAVMTPQSFEALALYLLIYLIMNLGAFWCVIVLGNRTGSAELSSFKGAAYGSPVLFVALFVCLISLTGLPPTAGFAAKFQLFFVVVGAGLGHLGEANSMTPAAMFFFVLALAGVLNSAVSLYYYMKVAKVMVFEKPVEGGAISCSVFDSTLALLFAVPLILLLNFGPAAALVKDAFGGVGKSPPELVAPAGLTIVEQSHGG